MQPLTLIDVFCTTLPPRPKVTGAALRSVLEAEQRFQSMITNLCAEVTDMCALMNTDEQDVTGQWCLSAIRKVSQISAILEQSKQLPRRYTIGVGFNLNSYGCWKISKRPTYFRSGMEEAVTSYYNKLVEAGVPMPPQDPGIFTEQFWKDAIARGC